MDKDDVLNGLTQKQIERIGEIVREVAQDMIGDLLDKINFALDELSERLGVDEHDD